MLLLVAACAAGQGTGSADISELLASLRLDPSVRVGSVGEGGRVLHFSGSNGKGACLETLQVSFGLWSVPQS